MVNKAAGENGLAATLYSPTSGREMQVLSIEPWIYGERFTLADIAAAPYVVRFD